MAAGAIASVQQPSPLAMMPHSPSTPTHSEYGSSDPVNPTLIGSDDEKREDDVDDDDLEPPDFYYDWLKGGSEHSVIKPSSVTTPTIKGLAADLKGPLSNTYGGDLRFQSTLPPSVHSSASSTHVLPAADKSMASSSSSSVPTPPDSSFSITSRVATLSLSYSGDPDERSDHNSPSFSIGRSFQRVVSAPVGRPKTHDDGFSRNTDYKSIQPSTSGEKSISRQTESPNTNRLPSRSTYVTPGASQRILTSSAVSGRRIVGLSRFGGPARRVVPQLDLEDRVGDDELRSASGSPQLIDVNDRLVASNNAGDSSTTATIQPPMRGAVENDKSISYHIRTEHDRDDLNQGGGISSHAPPPLPPMQQNRVSPPPLLSSGKENTMAELSGEGDSGGNIKNNATHVRREQERHPAVLQSHARAAIDIGATAPMRASRPAPPLHIQGEECPPLNLSQPSYQARTTIELTHNLSPPIIPTPPPALTQAPPTAAHLVPIQKRSFLVNGTPYERLGILGKGGSSKVYSVLCPGNRVVYALKRVALDRADAETYQSYTNEIELLRRLRGHDRIIQLIDHQITFNQGNRPKMLMMVMECGEIDFAALLDEQRGKHLDMNFVGLYWQQMLEAVQAVHAENVVHTDLKPANFVLVKGRLKIIDFGIAKAVANDTVNIQRDQQIGTVNYMSPEAIQRMNNQKVLKLSYHSDVWSLGCILYQMVYGSPPFHHVGGGPLAKMNVISDPSHRIDYPRVSTLKSTNEREGLSGSFAVVVHPAAISAMKSCLAYNKEDRLTIPDLLRHDFLSPARNAQAALSSDTTSITEEQMAMLVNFVLRENGLPPLSDQDRTAEDLFVQLRHQNSLSRSNP